MCKLSCFGQYRLHPPCIVKRGSTSNHGIVGIRRRRESPVGSKCVATGGATRAAEGIEEGQGIGSRWRGCWKGGRCTPFRKTRQNLALSTSTSSRLFVRSPLGGPLGISQMDVSISKMANSPIVLEQSDTQLRARIYVTYRAVSPSQTGKGGLLITLNHKRANRTGRYH